jgi:hypothetical protein
MRQIPRTNRRAPAYRSSNPKSGNILPLVAVFIALFILILNVDLTGDLDSLIGRTSATSSSANVLFGTRDGQKLIPDYKLIPDQAPSFYTDGRVAADFTASFADQDYDFVSDFERAAPSFYTSGDGVDQDFIDDFQDAGFSSNDEYVSGYALSNDEYIQNWWGSGVRPREFR